MRLSCETIKKAIKHLRAADPVISRIIQQVGPFTLKLQRDRYRALVRSIIAQQISTKAARSILGRVEALVHPEKPTAEILAGVEPDRLRSAGLSRQKAAYLIDLSQNVQNGTVVLRQIGRYPDEEVIRRLVQVKGIGRWTAQMFLMFSLGRPDVFPHDDLGIRTALRNMYELEELPDRTTSHLIAEPWRPYATVACWYCWRSVDLKNAEKATKETVRSKSAATR